MKSPRKIADEIVGRLAFSSNRMIEGRLVGEQYFAAQEIMAAIAFEQARTARLQRALFDAEEDLRKREFNYRMTADAHRRHNSATRARIIEALKAIG